MKDTINNDIKKKKKTLRLGREGGKLTENILTVLTIYRKCYQLAFLTISHHALFWGVGTFTSYAQVLTVSVKI